VKKDKDKDKTKEQLIGELALLRRRIAELEADETLREGEQFSSSLLNSSPNPILVINPDTSIRYVNPALVKLTGFTSAEIIGEKVPYPWWTEETLRKTSDDFKEALARGASRLEELFQKESGERFWVEVTSVPVIREGKMRYYLANWVDITDRKRAEVALRESEEKFRTFMETASDLMHIDDKDGNLTYVNDSMARTLGYSKEGMIGMHITSISSKEDAVTFEAKSNKLIEQGMFSHETVWSTKEGEKVYGEEKVVAFYDSNGKFVGGRGVFRDITDRKKAEEELRLRAQLLDGATDSIFLHDFDGKLIYVNETCCKVHGYTREEMMVMSLHQLSTPQYASLMEQRLKQVREEGKSIFETAHLRKDGSIMAMEVHSRVIESGGMKLIITVGRDITERKRLEGEKKELERRAYLASRLASIGEMVSGIAHEVNNPLVGVIGFAEILMERNDLPEDVRKRLKIINDGSQRVASIVDRLLSFARQSKPEKAYIDINQILETTLQMRTYEMQVNNIAVSARLVPELPWTVVDAGQLQQVFLNIMINAEEEMNLAHGKGKLLVRTEAVDKTIRISFKDDGPGIAKENLDRIFDPFFTTREVGQGTGLGLSICHGIIAEHGGQMYVRSKPGKGATFIVELPVITRTEQLELIRADVDEPRKIAKARILVVDDEPTNLQYLSDALEGQGHEVETVGNAGDALKKIDEGGYDLLLLDIKMPGMSGMELYKRIQKVAPSLADRVVFITGDVMGADTEDFLFNTGAPYITKPINSGRLLETINRVLLVK